MKRIHNWEDLYAVTEDGRIWAYPRVRVRNGHNIGYPGYWKKITISKQGYPTIALYKKDGGSTPKGYKYFVHRLVAEAYLDKPAGKNYVNHKDGCKTNNAVDNLEWCTSSENSLHAFNTGLRAPPIGDSHGMSKMTVNKVIEARRLFSGGGYTKAELGRRYGINKTTMTNILNGKTWRHCLQ